MSVINLHDILGGEVGKEVQAATLLALSELIGYVYLVRQFSFAHLFKPPVVVFDCYPSQHSLHI